MSTRMKHHRHPLLLLRVPAGNWVTNGKPRRMSALVGYNCIVSVGFFDRKFGLLSLGKARCDRVALSNLRCMLCVFVFPKYTEH